MNKKKRVYISGTITGRDYHTAFADFDNARILLLIDGYATCNPMRICRKNWGWLRCMAVCLFHLIFRCSAIYMLTGYQYSRGAKIELKIAKKLKKTIYYAERKNRKLS